jgi:predicted dehydrogenase
MSEKLNRRHFLGAAASGVAWGVSTAASVQDKLVVGVMGTGGRGTEHARQFAKIPNVEVAYVCDVDEKRVQRAAAEVDKASGKAPKAVPDFRRILDDKDVNILVIATCNHWHAPAAILACAAGKHVYVEKPCSHNPREGELMVEAANKYDRRVQMGNQRRSWPKIIEAIQEVRSGAIGRAYFAQAWYQSVRPSIGKGKEAAPPAGLDYDLWQGPATRRPFHDNYLHYNWHWFWHWGNGELGNNGIHMIDLCRWGLGVDYPNRVTSAGGRYRFPDDQETPDTHIVSFDFADRKSITWEGFSCVQMPDGKVADVMFYGDNGTLALHGGGYTISDPKGKEIRKATGPAGDLGHITNFLDSIRNGEKLNSPIDEGHKSTLLCHLGNIAHRTGRALRCDPQTGRILEDSSAMTYWSREYAPGWEPKV